MVGCSPSLPVTGQDYNIEMLSGGDIKASNEENLVRKGIKSGWGASGPCWWVDVLDCHALSLMPCHDFVVHVSEALMWPKLAVCIKALHSDVWGFLIAKPSDSTPFYCAFLYSFSASQHDHSPGL